MIEWNGRSLQGKSYQEVADIIAESRQEAHVELIVSRSMGSKKAAQATWRHTVASRGMQTVYDATLTVLDARIVNCDKQNLSKIGIS